MTFKYDPNDLKIQGPLYYKYLFPFGMLSRWLSYGTKSRWSQREIAYVLPGNVYIRFDNFESKHDFRGRIESKNPEKINIGAVYNMRPSERSGGNLKFRAWEKELVFDIDISDYDECRTCCAGKGICKKCWKFMVVAGKILDAALREDFGFRHILWIFSGRRGIHCWGGTFGLSFIKIYKMANVAIQPVNVSEYLSKKQSDSSKEVGTEWAELEELYNKRLWHQVTLKLETFIKHPILQHGDALIQLYNNFISTIENKINPLSLVEICAFVVEQFTDKKEAVEFIHKLETKVKMNTDAQSLCKVLAGQIYLDKLNDYENTKKIIEEVEATLDNGDGVTTVHGKFYLLASQYYRLQGDHGQYYRTALRYLGCIDLDTISIEIQHQHAFFLGLAALLGEGVYNLGELLAHPVLDTLKSTENAWLVELLYAFNSGDIQKFHAMKPQWSAISDLAAQELFLRQKISLLCLMEMTFKRPSHDRQLTFDEISKETHLPINEIELLVMKALAQGLVRGAIDQVANTVNMTWVQPRVLDRTQISNMVQRLDIWCKHVSSMELLLENKASEILTL